MNGTDTTLPSPSLWQDWRLILPAGLLLGWFLHGAMRPVPKAPDNVLAAADEEDTRERMHLRMEQKIRALSLVEFVGIDGRADRVVHTRFPRVLVRDASSKESILQAARDVHAVCLADINEFGADVRTQRIQMLFYDTLEAARAHDGRHVLNVSGALANNREGKEWDKATLRWNLRDEDPRVMP